MRPIQWGLLGAVLLLALLVGYLALRNRQAPVLPADGDHATFRDAATCLVCHEMDGVLPRSRNHPVGQDCMRCHGVP